jgi:hypothetical protein
MKFKRGQQKAKTKRNLILKLNSKQLSDLKASVSSETELWKKNLVEKDWLQYWPEIQTRQVWFTESITWSATTSVGTQ